MTQKYPEQFTQSFRIKTVRRRLTVLPSLYPVCYEDEDMKKTKMFFR